MGVMKKVYLFGAICFSAVGFKGIVTGIAHVQIGIARDAHIHREIYGFEAYVYSFLFLIVGYHFYKLYTMQDKE